MLLQITIALSLQFSTTVFTFTTDITIYDDCYYKLQQNTDAFYEPNWWFSKDRYIYSIASSVETSIKAFCERLVSSYLNEEKQRNKMEVEGFNRWAFLEEPVFDLKSIMLTATRHKLALSCEYPAMF